MKPMQTKLSLLFVFVPLLFSMGCRPPVDPICKDSLGCHNFITETNKVHFDPMNSVGEIRATLAGLEVGKAVFDGKAEAQLINVTGPKGAKVEWTNSLTSEIKTTILDGDGDYDHRGHYIIFDVNNWRELITEENKVNFLPIESIGEIYASINGYQVAKAVFIGRGDAQLIKVTGPRGTEVVWTNNRTNEKKTTILDGDGDYDHRGHYIAFSLPIIFPTPPPPIFITEINKVYFIPYESVGAIYASINGTPVAKVFFDGTTDAQLIKVSGPLGTVVEWTNSITNEKKTMVLDGRGDNSNADAAGNLASNLIVFKVPVVYPTPPPPTPIPFITEVNKVHFDPMNSVGAIYASIHGTPVAKAYFNGSPDAQLIKVSGPLGTVVEWTNSITQEKKTTVLDGRGDYSNGDSIGILVGHTVVFKVLEIRECITLVDGQKVLTAGSMKTMEECKAQLFSIENCTLYNFYDRTKTVHEVSLSWGDQLLGRNVCYSK